MGTLPKSAKTAAKTAAPVVRPTPKHLPADTNAPKPLGATLPIVKPGEPTKLAKNLPTNKGNTQEAGLPPGATGGSVIRDEDYSGRFIEKSTGNIFARAIVKDDPYKKTHHFKNQTHHWSGTEREASLAFEKE